MRCLVRICANDFSLTVPCPQCRTQIEKSELGFPSVPLEVQFSCTAAYDIAMNDVVTENPFQGIFERMIERHEAESYVARARRGGPPQFDENVVAVEPAIQAAGEEEIESEGILTQWTCEECETDEVDMISRDPRYCMSCCYNING